MMLWGILSFMTLAALALVLSPLLRTRPAPPRRVDYDIIIYRDQLAEIDKDITRGLLLPDQAEVARAEIYRRMLASEDAEAALSASTKVETSSSRGKLVVALIILVVIPLGAGLTYAILGSPELPGKPYAARQNDPEFIMAKQAELMEAQLKISPDVDGYKSLADTYFTLRRYDEAAATYQKIIQMNGGNATIFSELGQSIALAHDDLVVPEARQAFVKALRLDSHDARARFYLGLSETQIGEPRRAVAIWRDLEKEGPADAPWMDMVKEYIQAFAKDGGFDPATISPTPPNLTSPHDDAITTKSVAEPQTAPTASTDLTAAPTKDAATAIMSMSPDQQNVMIHKMVDRLAEKMKANPNDADGWQRLATAYRVLGETDKAKDAEDKAAALQSKAGGK